MKLLITALMLAFSVSAFAKIDSEKLSCSKLQSIVQSEGSALIYTGQYIYGVFVRDASQCAPNQTTEPAWISAKDKNECFVGYTCEEKDNSGGNH